MDTSQGQCSCRSMTQVSLYTCVSLVVVVYLVAGLYALWVLWRHRKVSFVPLFFFIAGLVTAGLTCSVTSVVQGEILCIMKVDKQAGCASWWFFLLGLAEAVILLGVALSNSYFNI